MRTLRTHFHHPCPNLSESMLSTKPFIFGSTSEAFLQKFANNLKMIGSYICVNGSVAPKPTFWRAELSRAFALASRAELSKFEKRA